MSCEHETSGSAEYFYIFNQLYIQAITDFTLWVNQFTTAYITITT